MRTVEREVRRSRRLIDGTFERSRVRVAALTALCVVALAALATVR